MTARYQTTSVEASTLLNRLWCRNCGGPLLTEQPFDLPDLTVVPDEINLNVMMVCPRCMVPDRNLAPDAGRLKDRLLYHLLIEGVVRIRTKPFGGNKRIVEWVPPEGLRIHEKTAATNSARSYLSEAVRGIPGIWVATHSRLHKTSSSYMLGHLKVTSTPCSCDLE